MAAMAAILDFRSKTIAFFDLQVYLIFSTKFLVNCPFGSGEPQNRFQDGGHGGNFGFPIRMILAFYDQYLLPSFESVGLTVQE